MNAHKQAIDDREDFQDGDINEPEQPLDDFDANVDEPPRTTDDIDESVESHVISILEWNDWSDFRRKSENYFKVKADTISSTLNYKVSSSSKYDSKWKATTNNAAFPGNS